MKVPHGILLVKVSFHFGILHIYIASIPSSRTPPTKLDPRSENFLTFSQTEINLPIYKRRSSHFLYYSYVDTSTRKIDKDDFHRFEDILPLLVRLISMSQWQKQSTITYVKGGHAQNLSSGRSDIFYVILLQRKRLQIRHWDITG